MLCMRPNDGKNEAVTETFAPKSARLLSKPSECSWLPPKESTSWAGSMLMARRREMGSGRAIRHSREWPDRLDGRGRWPASACMTCFTTPACQEGKAFQGLSSKSAEIGPALH